MSSMLVAADLRELRAMLQSSAELTRLIRSRCCPAPIRARRSLPWPNRRIVALTTDFLGVTAAQSAAVRSSAMIRHS